MEAKEVRERLKAIEWATDGIPNPDQRTVELKLEALGLRALLLFHSWDRQTISSDEVRKLAKTILAELERLGKEGER